ncbi:MAG: hypothetical protein AAF936_08940 [Pseudomonadota bacterium]
MAEQLYRQIYVWTRHGHKSAKRYTCFENLETNLFHIQSADFFHLPYSKKTKEDHAAQLVELFIEDDGLRQRAAYKSLSEAIRKFDDQFS